MSTPHPSADEEEFYSLPLNYRTHASRDIEYNSVRYRKKQRKAAQQQRTIGYSRNAPITQDGWDSSFIPFCRESWLRTMDHIRETFSPTKGKNRCTFET